MRYALALSLFFFYHSFTATAQVLRWIAPDDRTKTPSYFPTVDKSIALTHPGQNLLWPWLRQVDVARQKCVGLVEVAYEELRVRRDLGDCNCVVRL